MEKSLTDLKQKGRRLLADGCALGDTSGRTKTLKEKSVFALTSKNFEFTILASSSEKKKIFRKLNQKYNEERSKAIIHSVKLYFALKNYMNTCSAFYICADGFRIDLIRYYLKQFLGQAYHNKKIIIKLSLVQMFGKENIADRLAWEVNKNGKKPTMQLKEKHFKKLGLIK